MKSSKVTQSPVGPSTLPHPMAPSKGASSAGLPPITLEKGQSLYVHLTYNSCACGTDLAEMYVGTREKHDRLVATAEIPNPYCNYLCHLGCLSFCYYTHLKIRDPSGADVGQIELGRKLSIICCLPHMDVTFNGKPIGTLMTKCCIMNTCRKELTRDETSVYTSDKYINSKLLSCFLPGCYAAYRMFFKNRTTVEYYTLSTNESAPTFEVINVTLPPSNCS